MATKTGSSPSVPEGGLPTPRSTGEPCAGRPELEALGEDLARAWRAALRTLPGPVPGPRRLAAKLGESVPTLSRLLKAVRHPDPLVVLLHLPGPDPQLRVLDALAAQGSPAAELAEARAAVARLETLIRDVAGDRGRLHALLQGWIPEEREAFAVRRRQAAYKALSELKGVACDLDLAAFLLVPAAAGPGVDLVCVLGRIGLWRLRSDRAPRIATRSLDAARPERAPCNLAGESLLTDGAHALLEEFSSVRTGTLRVARFDDTVQYVLDDTSLGSAARCDLLLAELNRGALPRRAPDSSEPERFVYHSNEVPARALVVDVFLHHDLARGEAPTVRVHDTVGDGPCSPHVVARRSEEYEDLAPLDLGPGLRRAHLPEYAGYEGLIEHVLRALGHEPAHCRGVRYRQEYPLPGTQVSLLLPNGDRGA